jgi:hypothetical protein
LPPIISDISCPACDLWAYPFATDQSEYGLSGINAADDHLLGFDLGAVNQADPRSRAILNQYPINLMVDKELATLLTQGSLQGVGYGMGPADRD